MLPMRRLVAQCLIVSLLFAGVAWSADIHAEAYFGHEAGWSQSLDQTPDTGPAADTCDHCCHGTAHYTGLLAGASVLMAPATQAAAVHGDDAHRSFALPPPIEPPIS